MKPIGRRCGRLSHKHQGHPHLLEITTPPGCTAEREYVLGVIFEDWLGLSYNLRQADVAAVTVRLADQPGEVCLPDTFFSQFVEAPGRWLEEASMPSQPLQRWDSQALAVDITLVEPVLPVIFGEPIAGDAVAPASNQSAGSPEPVIRLPIDIFGSAFFMLSRYEEVVRPDRDEHDRFPAWASLASQEAFLDRPIVDEYMEILWAAMQQRWPVLKRRQHRPETLISCDVDSPFLFFEGFRALPRRLAKALLTNRSTRGAAHDIRSALQARKGNYELDPHRWGLELMMQTNEQVGRAVAFYFIPEKTDRRYDHAPSLDDPRMGKLLKEINARGHEIGLHPGYNTFKSAKAMAESTATLRRVLDDQKINQDIIGGRQHYLRWKTSTTAVLWDRNQLSYDTTLGYADRPGFRCGTCREYSLFDLEGRRTLELRERPLIVMDKSLLSPKYMGLETYEEAKATIESLKKTANMLNGNFTVLWHNTYLETLIQRELLDLITRRD